MVVQIHLNMGNQLSIFILDEGKTIKKNIKLLKITKNYKENNIEKSSI